MGQSGWGALTMPSKQQQACMQGVHASSGGLGRLQPVNAAHLYWNEHLLILCRSGTLARSQELLALQAAHTLAARAIHFTAMRGKL